MPEPFLGEIRMTSFNFPPKGWGLCNGQLLPINQNQALFSLLGTTYGGDGRVTFALPNLQGCVPVHAVGGSIVQGQRSGSETVSLTSSQVPGHAHPILGSANQATSTNPAGAVLAQKPRGGANVYGAAANTSLSPETLTAAAGGSQPHNNMQPYSVLSFVIALTGLYPSRDLEASMADPYIGEIRMFAGTFAPVGWAFCHGQPLPISEYENLFNLIGTTYGGDGQSTFNLPDLRGRAPLHHDGQHLLGEIGGAEAVTLAAQHVPPHTHLVLASSQAANAGTVSGKVTATTAGATKLYAFASGSPATNMSANAVAAVGAGMPHENRMPYMAVHFIIALTGQYPTQF